jgi:peptidoglycan/xylan/chitin deacetylase (PgdA/CDA1 family)
MVIKLNYKILSIILVIAILFGSASAYVLSARPQSPDSSHITDGSKTAICIPILMYHEVKLTKAGKDVIMPYEFETDLKYLKENGYETIVMSDLIDYVYSGKPLPEKPIILTFDDGYLNNYTNVFPLLKKYNMKIVMSIIGKNTDDFTNIPDDNIDYSHVTWNQINEMISSGLVEIQNHSYNMHTITSARFGCQKKYGESLEHYTQFLSDDIIKLQDELKFYTGYTPSTFTYPYGKVSEDSLPIIKKLGFKASLSCDYGLNLITRDPSVLFGLRRICRSHGYSAQKALNEAMKTLRFRNIENAK